MPASPLTPEPNAARLAEVVAWLGATPGGSTYAVTVRELAASHAALLSRAAETEKALAEATSAERTAARQEALGNYGDADAIRLDAFARLVLGATPEARAETRAALVSPGASTPTEPDKTEEGDDRSAVAVVEPLTFARLQSDQVAWVEHNFGGRPSHIPLLGALEELGELAHAHIKGEQGIRHTPEEVAAKKFDAIGDIVIYLSDYCTAEGIDFQRAVEETWAQVSRRDWKADPVKGNTVMGAVFGIKCDHHDIPDCPLCIRWAKEMEAAKHPGPLVSPSQPVCGDILPQRSGPDRVCNLEPDHRGPHVWRDKVPPESPDTVRPGGRVESAGSSSDSAFCSSQAEPFVLTLAWECESCGLRWTVDAPGFPGDGSYHYVQPGNEPCGPIYAHRSKRDVSPSQPVDDTAPTEGEMKRIVTLIVEAQRLGFPFACLYCGHGLSDEREGEHFIGCPVAPARVSSGSPDPETGTT